MVNINAYHQPGVEAGKKAAGIFLELLQNVKSKLNTTPQNAEAIASQLGEDPESVYHCLVHLSSNANASMTEGDSPLKDLFTE